MPALSVVVPVYKCERCLVALYERLAAALADVEPDFELILVDDASPDGAWPVMQQLAAAHPRVKALQLSRNFGQHAAITAGIAEARGARVVVMDCDLQDPPEEVPTILAKADEGFDIVYAKRKRKQHSGARRAASRAYFWLLNRFAPFAIDPELGSFTCISRPVADAYLRIRNHDQHYLFMLHWLGFRSAAISYAHAERGDQGESSYTVGHLIRFALEGLFLQTTNLLRLFIWFGGLFAAAGFLMAAWIVADRLTRSLLPGWASLSVLILIVGGSTMMGLGVIALYIGKIFEQVQQRPHYVVARRAGGDTPGT